MATKEKENKSIIPSVNPANFNIEALPELIKAYYGNDSKLAEAAEKDGIVAKLTKVWDENKKYLGMVGIAFAAMSAKNILDGYFQKLRFQLKRQSEVEFNSQLLKSMNVDMITWRRLDSLRQTFGNDTAIIKVRYIDLPILDDVVEVASHDLSLSPSEVTDIEKLLKAVLELGQVTGEYGKLCNLMLTGAKVRTVFTEENKTSFFNKVKSVMALDILAPDSYLTIADIDALYSFAVARRINFLN